MFKPPTEYKPTTDMLVSSLASSAGDWDLNPPESGKPLFQHETTLKALDIPIHRIDIVESHGALVRGL